MVRAITPVICHEKSRSSELYRWWSVGYELLENQRWYWKVKRRKSMVLNAQEVEFVLHIFCSLASHSAITNSTFRYLHVYTSVWSCSGRVCLCISTSAKTGKCSSNNQCWDESAFWRRYRYYKGPKHFLWRCYLNNSLCKTNLFDTYWKVKCSYLVCVSEQIISGIAPWFPLPVCNAFPSFGGKKIANSSSIKRLNVASLAWFAI